MAQKFASWNRLVEDFIVDIACGLANAAGYDFGHLLADAAGYDRRLQRGAEPLARRFHCKRSWVALLTLRVVTNALIHTTSHSHNP